MNFLSWQDAINGFCLYLRLELALSNNTIEAYKADLENLSKFLHDKIDNPLNLSGREIITFLKERLDDGIAKRSQARCISAFKSFFKYLEIEYSLGEDYVNPCTSIETPKLSRSLPEVLSLDEIERILNSIDSINLDF